MADNVEHTNWIEKHGPAALLFARQYAPPGMAEDAVQEGFIRFWKARPRARDAVALLYTCVRSAAMDLRRAEARMAVRHRNAAYGLPLLETSDAGARERREMVEAALVELPEAQRTVVVLKIWAGLTFSQIAQALGEPPNTVASRYRYGIEKLAQLLKPEVPRE